MELVFDSVVGVLKTNPWIGLLLISVALVYKFGPGAFKVISDFFKEYLAQKNDKIDKMIGSLDTNNSRFFTLLENQGKTIETIADKMVSAINKVGDGITSMEKTLLGSEARVIEKISYMTSAVSDKIDKEISDCKDEIRDSKFETILKLTKSEVKIESNLKAKSDGDDR